MSPTPEPIPSVRGLGQPLCYRGGSCCNGPQPPSAGRLQADMPGYVAALQRLEAMDGVQQETLRGADGQWLVVPRVPVSYATSI